MIILIVVIVIVAVVILKKKDTKKKPEKFDPEVGDTPGLDGKPSSKEIEMSRA